MPSRRPLLAGAALLLLSLLLVALGAGLRGPLNPACAGRPYAPDCFRLLPTLLMAAALPVAIAGGVLVALWLGRRAAEEDEAILQGERPPSPPP